MFAKTGKPQGPSGPRGESGTQDYAFLYGEHQTVECDDSIAFNLGSNSGIVSLSSDNKTLTINSTGYYFITSAWSASGTGAHDLELAVNNEKIGNMDYILGTAEPYLNSAMTGCTIVHFTRLDKINIFNRGADNVNLIVPTNNTAVGSSSNAAATIVIMRVA